MRSFPRKAFDALCASALVLAAAAATPAFARGGGGGSPRADDFNSAGDYGAHFSSSTYGADLAGAPQRRPGGGYPGSYRDDRCNAAFGAQNPEMCG
jgi:hypothetical protein